MKKYRFAVIATVGTITTGIYVQLMFYVRYMIDSKYIGRELERTALYEQYQIILLLFISAILVTTLITTLTARALGYNTFKVLLIVLIIEFVIWFGVYFY